MADKAQHTSRRARARPALVRPSSPVTLLYPGLSRPVVLRKAPAVLDGLGRVIKGWQPQASAGTEPLRVLASVSSRPEGHVLDSVFLDAPLDGLPAASAVCGLVADLAQCYFEDRPDFLALHCGAFLIGGRLIALTGRARAGKSTLIARLTAEPDVSVLCDDVLPVEPGGIAHGLGIAPRLRLPLPRRASPLFRKHVAGNTGLKDDRYAYVTAPAIAPHGTRAPLSAIVVLSRRARGKARLHRLDPAEAIRHLMLQNMAEPGDGGATFDRITGLAATCPCLTLVYSDLEEAVALIRTAFGSATFPATDVAVGPPLPQAGDMAPPAPPADPDQTWRRHARVAVRRTAEGLFLWHGTNYALFRLNPVAAAVWTLLETPDSGRGIAATLAVAFPDVPERRIARDVLGLLGQMRAEDLVVRD